METPYPDPRAQPAGGVTSRSAPARIAASLLSVAALGVSAAACGSSASPSRTAHVAAACRPSGSLDQAQTAGAHVFMLHLGPREGMLMLTRAQAKAKHITTGELMVGGKMSTGSGARTMSGGMNMGNTMGATTMRHLEVHICRRATGTVVADAMPSITVRPATAGATMRIPVAVMEGVTAGAADLHYGNNVALRRGATYTITVRLGSDRASFKTKVPSST